jgi:hypothetical protein
VLCDGRMICAMGSSDLRGDFGGDGPEVTAILNRRESAWPLGGLRVWEGLGCAPGPGGGTWRSAGRSGGAAVDEGKRFFDGAKGLASAEQTVQALSGVEGGVSQSQKCLVHILHQLGIETG